MINGCSTSVYDLGTKRQIECMCAEIPYIFSYPIAHVRIININLHGYENNRR